MNAWAAFRTGIVRVLKYWQVVVVLYAINLLAGILLVFIPALHLVVPARLTVIQDAAQGVTIWMVQELAGIMPVEAAQAFALQELSTAVWFGLGAGAATPLMAWFTGSTLAGGVMLVYSEAPLPFRWRRFLWGCWHWAGAFLALSLFQTLFILTMLYAGIFLAQSARVGEAGGNNGLAVVLLFGLLLVVSVGAAVLEITRVIAVRSGTRNLHKSLGHALRFSFRHPFGLGSFYLLTVLLLLLVHAVFRLGIMPGLPLSFWPIVLVVQQGFVLARLLARSQRIAGAAALVGDQIEMKSGNA